jgi:hypothetical protein
MLSAAKHLGGGCPTAEILRCAQDDEELDAVDRHPAREARC